MNRKRSKRSKKSKKSKAGRKNRKNRKSHKRSFGSMYGLQGSDMHYSGVYPMTMNMKGEMPNLYNVKRTIMFNA